MSANTLLRWLLGRTEPAGVAWAAGGAAHPLSARVNGARAVSVSQAEGEAGAEKEWEPGVWARAAIGIYS